MGQIEKYLINMFVQWEILGLWDLYLVFIFSCFFHFPFGSQTISYRKEKVRLKKFFSHTYLGLRFKLKHRPGCRWEGAKEAWESVQVHPLCTTKINYPVFLLRFTPLADSQSRFNTIFICEAYDKTLAYKYYSLLKGVHSTMRPSIFADRLPGRFWSRWGRSGWGLGLIKSLQQNLLLSGGGLSLPWLGSTHLIKPN